MSSDEEDLFADSSSGDDTNELISAAKKKKAAPKRLASTKSLKNKKNAYESGIDFFIRINYPTLCI